VRINVAKIRHALETIARNCNPEMYGRIAPAGVAFGAIVVDPVDNTTHHQMATEALAELNKFGTDEVYDYQEG